MSDFFFINLVQILAQLLEAESHIFVFLYPELLIGLLSFFYKRLVL